MYTQRYLSDKADKEELSDDKSSPRAVPVQKEESQHVRLRNGKNGRHILHTHCETIVCEFSSIDKVELSTRPMQSEIGIIVHKACTDLVIWNNLALPSGTSTHDSSYCDSE